ncbi:MAG: hypothetical protein A3H96_17735 [Acidobacteria bacterium RIFCSPLOWO2_02_FULL_67_36]|nr:MAG: hypothetical protein A3H96_17735 [Acidobacteria bacterium RIFCSPLOWO2_02_FULL_67_36]OFW23812.1 MAG: hypothetical protein A3G21_02670 [Acidobacteria bacterium RIFCSPLOWO2_12_FULL_66_21]
MSPWSRAGWLATPGAVLIAFAVVQAVTGAFLMLYYVPSPDHAYDSVRFIISSPAGGWLVHGVHHYGASFVVVLTALHLLVSAASGAFKRADRRAWLTGVVLLLIVLGLALTGYLLPWDQRAYWATVVTINLSQLAPGAGRLAAAALRGGETIGALTLTRWYALHVIFLPAALVAMVIAHTILARRRAATVEEPPVPFYPEQAARTAVIGLLAGAFLLALARHGAPPLGPPADSSDTSYVPRPEWYFLGLFQLLKYFPGRYEVLGAIVIPALAVLALAALPWIDRRPERDLRRRPLVAAGLAAVLLAVSALTVLGWRDRPPAAPAAESWTVRAIGGRVFVERHTCARCHVETGVADPLEALRLSRGPEWTAAHTSDPEMIAPGLREPPAPVNEREIAAMVAYMRRLSGEPYPGFPLRTETAAAVFSRYCIGCHTLDGDGGKDGPDLSRIGRKHDAAALSRRIADPESVDPKAEMPSFGSRLSADELAAIAAYLAARR